MKSIISLVIFCIAANSLSAQHTPSDIVRLHGDTIMLSRRKDNTIFLPNASILKPGTVIQLEGKYLWVKIFNLLGTKENPVKIINKGQVYIGGYPSYTLQLTGAFFEFDGSADPRYLYGFVLHSMDDVPGAQSIYLGNCHDAEIHHIEIMNAASGILCNKTEGGLMSNLYFHHIYGHDMVDKHSNPPGRSEFFYMGSTNYTPYDVPYRFMNCRIEDCKVENIEGDGFQVEVGDFILRRDTVINWGTQMLQPQRNALQVSGSALIEDMYISKGSGHVAQILGVGYDKDSIIFRNMKIENVNLTGLRNEDMFYINNKNPKKKMNISFENIHIKNSSGDRFAFFNASPPESINPIIYKNVSFDPATTKFNKNFSMLPGDQVVESAAPVLRKRKK